ncbi:MAG: MFS transporter [Desulfitobacteriaceae bacterium]
MSEPLDPQISKKLWTKNFILIIVANFATLTGFYMLLPTLPIYIKVLTGQETLAGLAMGIFLVSVILIRPFAGRAVDSYGRKGIFILGLIIFLLCTLALNWARTLFVLLLLRFIQGFSWGYGNTASSTIVSDVLPRQRLAEGMGYYGLAMSVAMGLSPALALYIIGKYSFHLMFNVSAFAVFLAAILAFFVTYHKVEKLASKSDTVKADLFEKSALRPAGMAFFVTLNYSSVLSFIALYGAELNIVKIGLFFTVFAVSITLTRPLLGPLADKKGYDIVIIPGLLMMIVTMLIIFKAQSLPLFILAGVTYGIGIGAVQPTLQAMSVLNAPAGRRGAANATYFTFFDLGFGLGSIMWGAVAHAVGFSVMYLLTTVPILCALIFYVLFARQAKLIKYSNGSTLDLTES